VRPGRCGHPAERSDNERPRHLVAGRPAILKLPMPGLRRKSLPAVNPICRKSVNPKPQTSWRTKAPCKNRMSSEKSPVRRKESAYRSGFCKTGRLIVFRDEFRSERQRASKRKAGRSPCPVLTLFFTFFSFCPQLVWREQLFPHHRRAFPPTSGFLQNNRPAGCKQLPCLPSFWRAFPSSSFFFFFFHRGSLGAHTNL